MRPAASSAEPRSSSRRARSAAGRGGSAPARPARRARAGFASGARGYSRSRRSKAAAAAARSPRASWRRAELEQGLRGLLAARRDGTLEGRERQVFLTHAIRGARAAFGSPSHTTALPGSSAAASAAAAAGSSCPSASNAREAASQAWSRSSDLVDVLVAELGERFGRTSGVQPLEPGREPREPARRGPGELLRHVAERQGGVVVQCGLSHRRLGRVARLRREAPASAWRPAWAAPAAAGRRRPRPRRGPYWRPRAAASPPARIRTSSSWK